MLHSPTQPPGARAPLQRAVTCRVLRRCVREGHGSAFDREPRGPSVPSSVGAVLAFLLLAIVFVGCGPGPRVEHLKRHLPLPRGLTPHESEPAMMFAPRAAYIVGLTARDALPRVGSWVEGTPREWPEAVPPTLVAGRVVEREDTWARVEILAAVDSLRPVSLHVDVVKTMEDVHRIAKRALPVLVQGGRPVVPVGSARFVSGRETYFVLPSSAPEGPRLASSVVGIVTLRARDPNLSDIQLLAGRAPSATDLLVLGSPTPASPLPIEIAVHAIGEQGADERHAVVVEHLQTELRALGVEGIVINQVKQPASTETILTAHAQPQDALLQIAIYGEDAPSGDWSLRLDSQIGRVRPGAIPVWRDPPHRPQDLKEVALAAMLRALQMRGDHSLVAWRLETLLRQQQHSATAWVRWAPVLVEAYLQCGRPDWGLEVFLILERLGHGFPDPGDVVPGLAEAQLLSAVALGVEVPASALDLLGVTADVGTAALDTLVSLGNQERRWNEADLWRSLLAQRYADRPAGIFRLEYRDLETAFERGETVDPIDAQRALAAAETIGPLAVASTHALLLRHEMRLAGKVPDALPATIHAIDDVGAPALAIPLLVDAAELLQEDDAAEGALLEAAGFSLAARRDDLLVSIVSTLDMVRHRSGKAPLEGALAARFVEAASASDRELVLGRRALGVAHHEADLARARDALVLARGIFLEIGDDVNTAVAELRLAHLEIGVGRFDEAAARIAAARRYLACARDPALASFLEKTEQEWNRKAEGANPSGSAPF